MSRYTHRHSKIVFWLRSINIHYLSAFALLTCSSAICAQPNPIPTLSEETWKAIEPHILPEKHPLKRKLDRIFKESHTSLTSASLATAGFTKSTPRRVSECVVSTHSKMKGFYFKLYLDSCKEETDSLLIKRVLGAHRLRNTIDRLKYGSLFTVPKKWLYVLPSSSSQLEGTAHKNLLVIAEDMDIRNDVKNHTLWKDDRVMTRERLKALYTLMKQEGLSDSIYFFNVPFTKKGKMAFIDTEYTQDFSTQFATVLHYLGPKGQAIWKELMDTKQYTDRDSKIDFSAASKPRG